MNKKTDTVSEGPAKRIEPFGLHIFELIDSNIQKQDLSSTYIKPRSDIGVMNAVISYPPPPLKIANLMTCSRTQCRATI